MASEWPLLTGGRYSEVVVRTGLTVLAIIIQICFLFKEQDFQDELEENFKLCFEYRLQNSLRAIITTFPDQLELFARPEKYADVILSSINNNLIQDIGLIYQVNIHFCFGRIIEV